MIATNIVFYRNNGTTSIIVTYGSGDSAAKIIFTILLNYLVEEHLKENNLIFTYIFLVDWRYVNTSVSKTYIA